jgi:hypothetical protein
LLIVSAFLPFPLPFPPSPFTPRPDPVSILLCSHNHTILSHHTKRRKKKRISTRAHKQKLCYSCVPLGNMNRSFFFFYIFSFFPFMIPSSLLIPDTGWCKTHIDSHSPGYHTHLQSQSWQCVGTDKRASVQSSVFVIARATKNHTFLVSLCQASHGFRISSPFCFFVFYRVQSSVVLFTVGHVGQQSSMVIAAVVAVLLTQPTNCMSIISLRACIPSILTVTSHSSPPLSFPLSHPPIPNPSSPLQIPMRT